MTKHAETASAAAADVETISAVLADATTIHIWLKARQTGTSAEIRATVGGREINRLIASNSDEFEQRSLELGQGGRTVLAYDPTTTLVSVAYAFQHQNVLTEGVQILHSSRENAAPTVAGGYHFRPPFGWMNDPNGFGRFGDHVHLFYQHYPHSLRWNTMHWGHAVSDDYIHWRHLPIFLFPSSDLSARADGRGGAFSGSAIPLSSGDRVSVSSSPSRSRTGNPKSRSN